MTEWTIAEIREWLKQKRRLSEAEWQALVRDPRKGVQKLAQAYQRRRKKEELEQSRLAAMWKWEKMCWESGYQAVVGVDEAGRGPLAGPVVAAAVILPPDFDVTGINDSKKLTANERLELKKRIEQQAIRVGIGWIDAEYIDQYNILQATYQAMRMAVRQCQPMADIALVDALEIPDLMIPQKKIIKGDQRSHSIAAASIIAKTARDAWMEEAAKKYPEYGFEKHKGYCTAEHLAKIKQWGPSPIHRRTFAPLRDWFPSRSGEFVDGSTEKSRQNR